MAPPPMIATSTRMAQLALVERIVSAATTFPPSFPAVLGAPSRRRPTSERKPLYCRPGTKPARTGRPGFAYVSSIAAYLASIAVTSTSIAMCGHANWLTTRNVEAGIGALPKASARHFRAS
jgi:hypothetical protein